MDSQVSAERKTRKRVIDTVFASGEDKAPVNAPKWTKAGYNGTLKEAVESSSGVCCTPPNTSEVASEDDQNEDLYQANNKEDQTDDNNEEYQAVWDDNEGGLGSNAGENERGQNSDNSDAEDNNKKARKRKRSHSLVSEGYDSDYKDDSDE